MIKQKTEEEDLYARLQAKALKDVQRLAGELWTDYNEHDPGVTLLDALNYALLETDYRLRFDLPDYLTLPQGGFQPGRQGLFSPSQLFPVNPVIATDYRKLFVSTIEDLSDVRVVVHPERGTYDFVLDVWPDTPEARKQKIAREVSALYHRHRNLCENLEEVRFLEYDFLSLCGEVEMEETADADRLLAQLTLEVQAFLRGGVRFRRVDELLAEGNTPDEILEGPPQRRMVVDEASLCTDWQEYDLALLHQKLRALPGVCRITSLAFGQGEVMLRDALRRESPFQAYALRPFDDGAPPLVLTQKGKQVVTDTKQVAHYLYSMRAALYGAQNRTTDKEVLDTAPAGIHRNVFTHYPVRNDLPDCYQRHADKELSEYLALFDRLLANGLEELKELPAWMVPDGDHLSAKKECWMDVLDGMYGEDSNPAFLRKYEDAAERRKRRISFLGDVPSWGLDRGRGMSLQTSALQNESGVETYLKHLLNLEGYGVEMYLVEHSLLAYADGKFTVSPDDAFTITVVFLTGEKLLRDDEYRQGCQRLLFGRIPAHIQVHIYWQDTAKAGAFRSVCLFWKYALSTFRKRGLRELGNQLKNALADDHDWYCKV